MRQAQKRTGLIILETIFQGFIIINSPLVLNFWDHIFRWSLNFVFGTVEPLSALLESLEKTKPRW